MDNVSWAANPLLWVTAFILIAGGLIRFGVWIGTVNNDRAIFAEFMKYIRSRIDAIFDRLPNTPVVAKSASPLHLTEFGKKISTEASARTWAERNLKDAKEETEGKSPYAVQEYCYGFATLENMSAKEREKAESAAFNHGLPIKEVLKVFSIELRDLLLTQNQLEKLT